MNCRYANTVVPLHYAAFRSSKLIKRKSNILNLRSDNDCNALRGQIVLRVDVNCAIRWVTTNNHKFPRLLYLRISFRRHTSIATETYQIRSKSKLNLNLIRFRNRPVPSINLFGDQYFLERYC